MVTSNKGPAALAYNDLYDMADAVARAWDLAGPGEVVLLSPACASFDMYKDYAHRGQTFQKQVRGLRHEK